jgi:PIN domain nuclease of toxin-antitoxin system
MNVFDSSALLAFVAGEEGAEVVRRELEIGGVCGAANWSEIAQKVRWSGADWSLARGVLLSFELRVEPVTEADAERAAALWRKGAGLSLADRLCLGLGARLGATIWTADRQWQGHPGVLLVR